MPNRLIPLTLLPGLAVLGGYACMYRSITAGFFDVLDACIASPPGSPACRLTAPDIAELPKSLPLLAGIVEFFSQGLTVGGAGDLLCMGYMAVQFGVVWWLIYLEGLRGGNKGGVLSFTGVVGIMIQTVSVTITAPLYLTAHLLLSPVSAARPTIEDIALSTADISILPWATILSFGLPSAVLLAAQQGIFSPRARYIAIALWQPFPVYQSLIQGLLRRFSPRAKTDVQTYVKESGKMYTRAFMLLGYVQVGVINLIALSWLNNYPLNPLDILVPDSLSASSSPLSVLSLGRMLTADEGRAIVMSFLRWDIFCAAVACAVWASYLLASVEGYNIGKIVTRTLIAGPAGVAVLGLRDREARLMKEKGM